MRSTGTPSIGVTYRMLDHLDGILGAAVLAREDAHLRRHQRSLTSVCVVRSPAKAIRALPALRNRAVARVHRLYTAKRGAPVGILPEPAHLAASVVAPRSIVTLKPEDLT